jgi:dephospho-CoA kinase
MIDERGLEEPAAKARIGSQAPEEKKLAAADYVIDNRGSIDDLKESVDVLWEDLERRFGE